MYYALTLSGNIITGVHEAKKPITKETFIKNKALNADEVIPLALPMEYKKGEDIRTYNSDGTQKPLLWRIENGYAVLPHNKEIVNGELVDKEADVVELEKAPTLKKRLEKIKEEQMGINDKLMELQQLVSELLENQTKELIRGE